MLYGYAGIVDSMIARIRGELGEEARVVATGGLAGRVAAECSSIDRVEPFLTLEGLRLIYEKNRVTSAEADGSRRAASEDATRGRARKEKRS
jgi:type III pantothenate kinase